MCLSIPAKIVELDGTEAKADVEGTLMAVNLGLLENVKIGDYVLVHAGFAIQKYDAAEAEETILLIREALNAGRGKS